MNRKLAVQYTKQLPSSLLLCDDLQAVSMSDKARVPLGLFKRRPKKRKSPYPFPSIVWITAAWHKLDKENHWPKGEFSNMMSDEHDRFHKWQAFLWFAYKELSFFVCRKGKINLKVIICSLLEYVHSVWKVPVGNLVWTSQKGYSQFAMTEVMHVLCSHECYSA